MSSHILLSVTFKSEYGGGPSSMTVSKTELWKLTTALPDMVLSRQKIVSAWSLYSKARVLGIGMCCLPHLCLIVLCMLSLCTCKEKQTCGGEKTACRVISLF